MAYAHIQQRRAKRKLPHAPYGNLQDYVPWSFASRQPMLCAVAHNQIPDQQAQQHEMVHLVTTLSRVKRYNLAWIFTDGHPTIVSTKFFNSEEHLDRVDWPIMKEIQWGRTAEDGDRTRRRQAEFLIHNFAPWTLVTGIATMTEETAHHVRMIIAHSDHQPLVEVKRNWYF